MTSTATILLPFALLATLYSCSPCFAASVLTQSSSSSSSSSLESAVSRRSRRSTPFTYGIISEIVAGPVDICTIRIEDKNYFKTFFLDLSTGKLDGLTGPSKSRICQYEIVRVPMSDDTFMEMSFSKDAGRSEDACFTIEGPGMSETRLEPACRTDGNEKVFFRQKASGNDRRLTISMAEEVLRKNLNAQLMIRHLPDQVQEETLNIIGDLRLKCDHPNELLKPYLFKDGEGDLTLKLEEPEKRVYTAKYDLKGNVQGRYTCSWDEQKSADSIFRVNVFAPTINCSITMDGKDKTPDGKTLGDYLVIYRDSADTSSQLEFGCVLEKATMSGSPDGALGWDASTEEQQPNDFKTDSRADKISASFSRRISELIGNRDLKDVKYTCSVDHSKSKIDFRGGEPKACSIQIIVEETDPNPKSASMIYIGVAIAVVVLIVIVVVLVLWRRRKGTHDTTAGDHVSNHSSLNDYQIQDDTEAEKKFARPGILKNKGGENPSRVHTGKHRRPQITSDVIRHDVKGTGNSKNGVKSNGELTDDETTITSFNSKGSHDADAGSHGGSRMLDIAEDPEYDAGRMSWDPSGDELTSMPYKDELNQALSRRPKHINDEDDEDDDDDDDDESGDEAPKSGKSGVKSAESKSSFLCLDYEEVILPDDAISVDSDAIEEKKRLASTNGKQSAGKQSAGKAQKSRKAPESKSPTKKMPENKPRQHDKKAPEKKSPSKDSPDVVYTPVNKKKKTDLNNEKKRQGKTTEI